jgi:ABC-type nitrate/sulfonate/bicarbonate transport system substrate-binding protein
VKKQPKTLIDCLTIASLFWGCSALWNESYANATSSEKSEKVILQLRWDHQFQFAGYYAALWQGYYEDAGFDVDIRSAFEPGGKYHKVTKEVAAGRADFGTAGADILSARDKGAPLVIVSSVFQRSPVAFYAREETRLRSPADLTRLRVGTRPNGIAGVELRAMLRAESIDPGLVPQRPIKGKLGIHDIAARHLDVASGFTISAGWYARELGLSLTSLSPQTYGVDFYGSALFTNQRWVSEKPELVQKFAAASMKGWEYAIKHPTEIADRISRDLKRKIPIRNIRGFNRFQSGQVPRLTHHPVVQLGHTNPARWARMHDALKDAGSVTGTFNADDAIFDYERLHRARTDQQYRIILIILGAVLAAGAVGWLFMLRKTWRNESRPARNSAKAKNASVTSPRQFPTGYGKPAPISNTRGCRRGSKKSSGDRRNIMLAKPE